VLLRLRSIALGAKLLIRGPERHSVELGFVLGEITRPGMVAREIGCDERKARIIGVEAELMSYELNPSILCPHSVLMMTTRTGIGIAIENATNLMV
jgi:hypothetical protein